MKCPCCAGADTGDFDELCDTCAVAALEGRYPHECRRQDHMNRTHEGEDR